MDRYAVSLERSHQLRDIANYAKIERSQQIALKLLMMNEPIDKVMYLTDLSREEVTELFNQLPNA